MENRIFVSGKVSAIEVFHKRSNRYFYVLVDTDDLQNIIVAAKKLSVGIYYSANYCIFIPKGQTVPRLLHRFIMNTPEGLVVDHINHNGLDNRKINLRNTTHKVNRHNRIKGNKNPLYWSNCHLLEKQRYPI